MNFLLAAAVTFSVFMIVMLWRMDPKRLRIAGHARGSGGTAMRRLLATAALVPGLIFMFAGDSAAFLVWFGTCALAGWLTAQLRT